MVQLCNEYSLLKNPNFVMNTTCWRNIFYFLYNTACFTKKPQLCDKYSLWKICWNIMNLTKCRLAELLFQSLTAIGWAVLIFHIFYIACPRKCWYASELYNLQILCRSWALWVPWSGLMQMHSPEPVESCVHLFAWGDKLFWSMFLHNCTQCHEECSWSTLICWVHTCQQLQLLCSDLPTVSG